MSLKIVDNSDIRFGKQYSQALIGILTKSIVTNFFRNFLETSANDLCWNIFNSDL